MKTFYEFCELLENENAYRLGQAITLGVCFSLEELERLRTTTPAVAEDELRKRIPQKFGGVGGAERMMQFADLSGHSGVSWNTLINMAIENKQHQEPMKQPQQAGTVV